MLTKTQIKEIREHLEKAQNPIFFFDNDPDGLCSFLLLQRFIGRGKGVPIRSFPGLNKEYFRKVSELNADYIFILDKPIVGKDFFEKASQFNIPIVWIDHHIIEGAEVPDFVNYYNPLFNKSDVNISSELVGSPVADLCYQITENKDDLWLAVAGSIADHFIPEYYPDFLKQYPELGIKSNDAFEIFFKSFIGKIARIFGFALKDRTTNVIKMVRFLVKVKSPQDVLDEGSKNMTMHERFREINKKYSKLLQKAEELIEDDKILFFQYAGELSISSDLSNELIFKHPNKIIVVAYLSGIKANISIRGKKSRKYMLKAIEGLEDSTGGGHEDAAGARIRIDDLEKFRERLKELVGEN